VIRVRRNGIGIGEDTAKNKPSFGVLALEARLLETKT
jgi:hypothetical protein